MRIIKPCVGVPKEMSNQELSILVFLNVLMGLKKPL